MDIVEWIEEMFGCKLFWYQKIMLRTHSGRRFNETYDKLKESLEQATEYKKGNKDAARLHTTGCTDDDLDVVKHLLENGTPLSAEESRTMNTNIEKLYNKTGRKITIGNEPNYALSWRNPPTRDELVEIERKLNENT